MIRYCKDFTFPPYAFLPGVNAHPNHSGGYRHKISDPVAEKIPFESPGQNQFLSFSVDLFNHAYFWESHIYLEALWNAHARRGNEANFLKAMIKLAAAGVKIKKGEKPSARVHLRNASEQISKLMKTVGADYLGFSLEDIHLKIERSAVHGDHLFEIHPHWKSPESRN